MEIVAQATEIDSTLLGIGFDRLKELLRSLGRMRRTAPSTHWCIGDYSLGYFSTGSEDGQTTNSGLTCGKTVPNVPSYFVSSKTRYWQRWQLMLNYRATDSEVYDYISRFNVYNRHDEVIGTDSCKMALSAITLTIMEDKEYPTPTTDLVEDEVNALLGGWERVVASTADLHGWSKSGFGMAIRCEACFTVRKISNSDIAPKFHGIVSLDDAISRLRCRECGHRGATTLSPLIPPIPLMKQHGT